MTSPDNTVAASSAEREAFEAWCGEQGLPTHRLSDSYGAPNAYREDATYNAWIAWQARALLASAPVRAMQEQQAGVPADDTESLCWALREFVSIHPCPLGDCRVHFDVGVQQFVIGTEALPEEEAAQFAGMFVFALAGAFRRVLAASPSAPPVAGDSVQQPVAWQYRWHNPGNYTNVPPNMLAWDTVDCPHWQPLEAKLQELRDYRYDGKPVYEVRALYAAPIQQAAAAGVTDNRTRPLTDQSQPWTPEHCKTYPRRASEEIEYLRSQLAAGAEAQQDAPATLTDEQIKARCAAAGIQWIAPDADPDGYPGGFDMCTLAEMRAALSGSPAVAVAEPLTDDEVALLDRVLEDFADCGETEVPHSVLMDFARRGYLECDRFNSTEKASQAIASRCAHGIGSPSAKEGSE